MTPLFGLCAAATGLGALGWLAYHYSLAQELAQARRETSRFPMFQARDALVQLVADNEMRDHDPAWFGLYQTVTLLLNLNDRVSFFLDCVSKHIEYLIRVERDSKLKARVGREIQLEEETALRVPAFGLVRNSVNDALKYMIDRRTNAWHRMLGLLIFISGKLIVLSLSGNLDTARKVKRSLRHPSPDDFAGWSLMNDDPASSRAA